jgi:pyruvate/2-oxoglutarate dehydrogenase complex dihydrolipoamide dehydrogenase (E3) component
MKRNNRTRRGYKAGSARRGHDSDIRIGRFPFVGNGKAIGLGEHHDLVKVIFDKKTGQLLGADTVGIEVTEMWPRELHAI